MSDLDDKAPEPTCGGCYCCSGTGYFSGDELRAQAADRERQLAEAQAEVRGATAAWEVCIRRADAAEAKLRAVQQQNEVLDINVGVLTERLAKVAALRDELRATPRTNHLSSNWDRGRRHARIAVADRLDAAILGGDK